MGRSIAGMKDSLQTFFARLLSKTNWKRQAFFLIFDTLFICASLYLAFWVRFEGNVPADYFPGFYYYLLLAVVIKISTLAAFKVYNFSWGLFGLREAVRLIFAILTSFLVFGPVAMLLRNRPPFGGFPRGVLLADFVLTVSMLYGLRISKRTFTEIILRNGKRNGRNKRTLIIGAGEAGVQLCKEMQNNPRSEYLPVGFIDDDPAKKNLLISGIKVFGPREAIPRAIEQLNVDEVLIAIPSANSGQIKDIVEKIRQANKKVEIKILPSLLDLPGGNVDLTQIESIQPEDLLGRDKVVIDYDLIRRFVEGKRILVTGAGGSIGSEVVRTCLRFEPEMLFALDIDETELFVLEQNNKDSGRKLRTIVADIRDRNKIRRVYSECRPRIVIHAAAYKHVPVMEEFPEEAIKTNVWGTRVLAEEAMKGGVEKFINISTDKAINPSSVMGASKRVAEELLRTMNALNGTRFISVRFGNVLGSRGSVIPLFKDQIKRGGPVTVTHPEMKRYFMTISEAVLLVLEAAAVGEGGETFVLDMGEPVKIDYLAREMIRLAGKEPDVDIAIVYSGFRAGEKLFEEILGAEEGSEPTGIPKIFKARNKRSYDLEAVMRKVEGLIELCNNSCDREDVVAMLKEIVPTYRPGSCGMENGKI
ncbi:MAG: nucleoside-diphosphate sugar epimerase/dehydratase [Candidatus Saccharicenans sp.]